MNALAQTFEAVVFVKVVGKGPGARSMKLAVKPFTLVGATTR
jgi:Holliday junction resolvasome RuvABC ATP-dependent DNA helicase subunit